MGYEYRLVGCFVACLVGLGVPAFLLGPYLLGGIPFEHISNLAKVAAVGCAVFGLWLLTVSVFADLRALEKVLEPFQGSEVAILFLPYMLFIGTVSIWRRVSSRANNGHAP
jgi:hypothetical protein